MYGDEKIRHMSRSILPAKARKGARLAKAAANRQHRRASTTLTGVEDAIFPDKLLRQRQDELVEERRQSDKLSHYERWAVQRTKDIPQPERSTAMRSVLPEGVIGMHAMSHLVNLPEFRNPNEEQRYYWRDPVYAAQRQRLWSLWHRKVRRAVEDAYKVNLADLNRALKRASMPVVTTEADLPLLIKSVTYWGGSVVTGMPWEPVARVLRLL